MIHLNIKGLSTNQAYRGRRFTSRELKAYKEEVTYLLPKLKIPDGYLTIKYRFGMSSKGSDADNIVKPLTDILAEVYGFNDNRVYKYEIEKVNVKKTEEFVEFLIASYEPKIA